MAESLRELAIELKKAKPIKDSGERTEFSTGAVRDMHEGKGDMASIPWEAILRFLPVDYIFTLCRDYHAGGQQWLRYIHIQK